MAAVRARERALPFTTFAAEGEEVELEAEGHLAVGADCFYIAGGHLAEGLGGVGVLGGHGGQVGMVVMI